MKPDWCRLRNDFEALKGHQFTVVWSSIPTTAPDSLASHWMWFRGSDSSLRARLSAIALRGAQELGGASEDDWYDRLRDADFVEFKLGTSRDSKSAPSEPTSIVEGEWGYIDDVVKQSITLCHRFEAGFASKTPTRPSDVERRKPGRPQTIPDWRKAEAKALKDSGGSNRQAAAIIYDTKYPTPQQVKNVTSILRNYANRDRT